MLGRAVQMDTSVANQSREGRPLGRGVLTYAVLIAAFGVFLPWQKGFGFLDPALLSAYACLGVVFAGPAAANSFENRPESLMRAIYWIASAVAFGEAIAVTMLVCALLTISLTHHGLALFALDPVGLMFAVIFGLAASVTAAAMAAWSSLQFSPAVARRILRVVFLGLIVLFFLQGRRLPEAILPAIAIALVAASLFLSLLALFLRRA